MCGSSHFFSLSLSSRWEWKEENEWNLISRRREDDFDGDWDERWTSFSLLRNKWNDTGRVKWQTCEKEEGLRQTSTPNWHWVGQYVESLTFPRATESSHKHTCVRIYIFFTKESWNNNHNPLNKVYMICRLKWASFSRLTGCHKSQPPGGKCEQRTAPQKRA